MYTSYSLEKKVSCILLWPRYPLISYQMSISTVCVCVCVLFCITHFAQYRRDMKLEILIYSAVQRDKDDCGCKDVCAIVEGRWLLIWCCESIDKDAAKQQRSHDNKRNSAYFMLNWAWLLLYTDSVWMIQRSLPIYLFFGLNRAYGLIASVRCSG